MDALRKIFGQSILTYIVAAVFALAVAIFRFITLLEGLDLEMGWYQTLTTVGWGGMSPSLAWHEILSVSGYATFLIGALMLVTHWGALDIFGYVCSFGRRKYRDYTDYSQQKAEKRNKAGYIFVPFFVIGLVLFLISCIFS